MENFFLKKYRFGLIFCLIFAITIVFRFLAVANNNIAFTSDQARDMLEIRQIAVSHSPKLLGPITDILGLYLGPFWYYLNLIPFVISGGKPISLVYFSIIIFHFATVAVYVVLSKKGKVLGFISSCLLLLSPSAFLTTRFSFNANAVLYFSSFYPLFIFYKSKYASFFEGLLCGVILQLQAAVGFLFLPISVVFHLKREKENRHFIPLFFGFLITLLPQVAFEISHRFVMTKALFTEFFGGSNFLGEKLSFFQVVLDRLSHFLLIFSGASYLSPTIVLLITLFVAIYLKKNSIYNQFLKNNLQILKIFFIFFLFFPYNIKSWYFYGLVPIAVFVFSSSLSTLWTNSKTKTVAIIIFCLTVIVAISSNINYLSYVFNNPSNDPSNLKNMLVTVDKVYESAGNKSFKVFSYLPSVYDYPYQYLFWWYGTKKFGYQPDEISYLPNVPEYIKNNSVYWTKKKSTTPIGTILIIQHDVDMPIRELDWRSKFDKKTLDITNLPWNTSVEKLNILIN